MKQNKWETNSKGREEEKECILKTLLRREYEFSALVPPGQRSKGWTAIAIRKEIPHKRLTIRITFHVVALRVYLTRRGICSIYLLSTEQKWEEDMRNFLYHLPTHMIMMGDFNAHNPLRGSEKQAQHGECLKIF